MDDRIYALKFWLKARKLALELNTHMAHSIHVVDDCVERSYAMLNIIDENITKVCDKTQAKQKDEFFKG